MRKSIEDKAFQADGISYFDLSDIRFHIKEVIENPKIKYKLERNILSFHYGKKSKFFIFGSSTCHIGQIKEMYRISCEYFLILK